MPGVSFLSRELFGQDRILELIPKLQRSGTRARAILFKRPVYPCHLCGSAIPTLGTLRR